jgi:CRISPR-associated protein Csm2
MQQFTNRQARELPKPNNVRYFDDKGRLDPDLMDKEAAETAQALKHVKTTQLRRFYDDVNNLQRRLGAEKAHGVSENDAFEALRADFKMLKAKATYAHGRSDQTFPQAFLQFVYDHVHSVKTARDFRAFCKHFQAVVAFHKFYAKD